MNCTAAGVECRMSTRKSYPSEVSDDEWAFVAPYLVLLSEDALQRKHDLREVFNALTGRPQLRGGHGPRPAVALASGGRLCQAALGRHPGRSVGPVSPESGASSGYDGHKRRQGSKVHDMRPSLPWATC